MSKTFAKRKSGPDNLRQNSVSGNKNSSGTGYIYLPSDVDRDQYINQVYNTHKVTIITENAEVKHDVYIGILGLMVVIFPKDENELGSPIYWVSHPIHKKEVIVEVFDFSDEYSDLKVGQFLLQRKDDRGFVAVRGDARNRNLWLTVDSNLEDGGELVVQVRNKTNTGKILFDVKGDIEILSKNVSFVQSESFKIKIRNFDEDKEGEKITEIQYKFGEGFIYLDEFGNSIILKDKEIEYITEKIVSKVKSFVINGGDQPLALADTLGQILTDAFKALASTTAAGSPLSNAGTFTNLLTEIEKIKSNSIKSD